jgi:O-antigen ligase
MKLHTAAACVAALFLASAVFGHTVALRLLLLAIGIVLASIVVAKDKQVRALPPIWIPFVLWGAWALLSLAWSLEPERTLKEWKNEVFYAGAALWICYVGAQARAAARIFLPVLGAAGAVACLVALAEFSRGWAQYNAGWHGGPGDHSSALLVLMPGAVVTAWWAIRRSEFRWIGLASIVLAVLMLAGAYTTLSRALWLAFAVQFVALATLLLTRKGTASEPQLNFKGRVIAYALTGAAIVGGGAVILSVQVDREAIGNPRGFEHDVRLQLWPQVSERIGAQPLSGYGFGRGMLRESLQAQFKTLDENLWHAHNLFLEVLLQLGIPGLALLLVLLGAVVREGWRIARGQDEAAAACGLALLAIVAGMLVRNMTDFLLIRQNALLFWGAVGVLLAIGGNRCSTSGRGSS